MNVQLALRRVPRQTCRSFAHTVRIILREDMPTGQGYANEVVRVKAGYARNYLLPNKIAVYATYDNFKKYNVVDPDSETPDQYRQRLQREASLEAEDDLKAYDLLKKYLRKKTLKIWRNTDPETKLTSPGWVEAAHVMAKLDKQLKIALQPEKGEVVHLYPKPMSEWQMTDVSKGLQPTDEEREVFIKNIMENEMNNVDENVKLRALGSYLARITLPGGYYVPLIVSIRKR